MRTALVVALGAFGLVGLNPNPTSLQTQVPEAQPALSSPEPAAENAPPAGSTESSAMASQGSLPQEVLIKGSQDPSKMQAPKPPIEVEVDVYETIRESLKPDPNLLLAESPFAAGGRLSHPAFLHNARVIDPWRTTFSAKSGIAFYPLEQLARVAAKKLDPQEAKAYQWNLSIADEEGKVFQSYGGASDPPAEISWIGKNDKGDWIKAGRPYSAVFVFADPWGNSHTAVGKPIQFTGIVHQEDSGLHVSLDSSVLFGSQKLSGQIEKPGGVDLLRAASDLIKRHYFGIPLRVRVHAQTKDLAEIQGKAVQEYLSQDLMLVANAVRLETYFAPFSEQRAEIILLNR